MSKNRFFIIALAVLLAASGFAQTNNQADEYPKAGFFFGAGMSSGIFTSEKLPIYPDFDMLALNPLKIGVYYELPLGPGNFFAGIESGYASGSNFGGGGEVDFIPVDVNATYAFGIANILYVGPSLKAGILGLLGHAEYKILPLLGAALDLELRYKYFPLSIYASGGVNAYPTTNGFNVLPTVEAGLRIPRGSFGRASGASSAPSVTNVAVSPATATVNPGATQQFTASVTGTGRPSQNVTWSVTGGSAGTSISPNGLLSVGANQPAGNLTVRATSNADANRSGTASVTVPGTTTAPPVIDAGPIIVIPQPPPPFQFAPTATSRIITLDNGKQGLFSSVYFEPDTGVLIERYRPILEEAGRLLAANPQLQLTLRTYTALFGTADGRRMVSMERGNFCKDYFVQNYNIAPSRITIEPYGSEREPLSARTDDWVSYRCAELIITE